ncbi:MAG: TlpA disulfide reductase family protein [Bacteroidota bacterium]
MNLPKPASFSIALFFVVTTICLNGCFTIPNQFTGLAPGYWRATLDVRPTDFNADGGAIKNIPINFEEATEGSLPFNFEVIYENENDFHIDIINGKERIRVPKEDIYIGLDRRVGKDTFLIKFPIYESYIKGLFESRVMEGQWVVTNRENYQIPFVAKFGKGYRFTELRKEPVMDISGKWEVHFEAKDDPEDKFPGIGEFEQEGNKLTGTFRTETGDYRYLEGTIQENKVYLSVFDGAHAFLFEAKILEDKSMIGLFRSGKHYQATWTATKNEDFELTDPNELTFLKEGYDKISFAFPNPKGKMISLDNPEYQGKAKIVQIFGTWCPNCREETTFLVDYLKKNPQLDLEVIALAFEKRRDKAQANEAVVRYKKAFGIDYEMVVAGYSNKKEAAQSLPMLNHILSYPTLIFIDKNDQVVKIHTGYNGTATSKYDEFVADFEATVESIVKS